MIIRIKILDISIEVENKDLLHVSEVMSIAGFINTKAIELYKERIKDIETKEKIQGEK